VKGLALLSLVSFLGVFLAAFARFLVALTSLNQKLSQQFCLCHLETDGNTK
jgi:hypothetical protein